jgi:hypothetical protein
MKRFPRIPSFTSVWPGGRLSKTAPVLSKFIPDFSNWKDHDSYQTAFQRLVKDLKAEASK